MQLIRNLNCSSLLAGAMLVEVIEESVDGEKGMFSAGYWRMESTDGE